ncbi:preprotein translocase subunit SecD [Blattabacterium cuenoti]|uniref:hypothetical protein n=1 Tax=Blattabacterium cuenoti TaxID=1653831 RepID=UPI001EEA989E|nr:hypothetical protein [Blattabacterium cuenoti]
MILLTIICLYYILSGTVFFSEEKEKNTSILSNSPSPNKKNKTLNLGLDLKGGISMTLEISEKDLLKKISKNYQNPIFLKALERTDKEKEKYPNIDYLSNFIDFFYKEKKKKKSNIDLSELFENRFHIHNNIEKFSSEDDYNSHRRSKKEIEKEIRKKIEDSIFTTYNILRSRIAKFGVTQPKIQRIKNSNKILIELSGIKDIDRIKNILQKKAELNFFEVCQLQEIDSYYEIINKIFSQKKKNILQKKIKKSNIKINLL